MEAQNKLLEIERDLLKEIWSLQTSINWSVADRAKRLEKMIYESVSNESNEPIFPKKLELSEEKWGILLDFFNTLKSESLVGNGSPEYIKEYAQIKDIKLEILKKL